MSTFGGCQPTTHTDLDSGAELASPAALWTLVRRLPRLVLDPENPPQRRSGSLMFRGFQTLPVLTAF